MISGEVLSYRNGVLLTSRGETPCSAVSRCGCADIADLTKWRNWAKPCQPVRPGLPSPDARKWLFNRKKILDFMQDKEVPDGWLGLNRKGGADSV